MEIRFGIDLGYSKCKVSFSYIVNKIIKSEILEVYESKTGVSSIAYYDEQNDLWLFGDEALKNANDSRKPIIRIKEILDNCHTTLFNSKSFYNKDCDYEFKSKTFTQRDVLNEFVRYLTKGIIAAVAKKQGFTITNKIVLTYPVNVTNEYKMHLKKIFEDNGFIVHRMLPEPVAAAISTMNLLNENNIPNILVVDMGADTCDIASLEHTVNRLSANKIENIHIGGNDFDKGIYNFVLRKVFDATKGENLTNYQRFNLLELCKEAKHYISDMGMAVIEYEGFAKISVLLETSDFQDIIDKDIKSISQLVADYLDPMKKDYILFTGGCAKSDVIMKKLKAQISNKNIGLLKVDDPIFTTSIGASMEAFDYYKTVSVSPQSYGVLAYDKNKNASFMSTLVKKNTPLPCVFKKVYNTNSVGQRRIDLHVLESSNTALRIDDLSKTNEVGNAVMLLSRASMLHTEPVELEISIDNNGVATISATSKYGDRAKIVISNREG
ncbi:MAG: Hsp70 family protein [Anaeroplasmataceae bacterium]